MKSQAQAVMICKALSTKFLILCVPKHRIKTKPKNKMSQDLELMNFQMQLNGLEIILFRNIFLRKLNKPIY